MAIQVKRLGSDVVEIFADNRAYYRVSYNPANDNWGVVRNIRGVVAPSTNIGTYSSAKEVVDKVKAMLTEKGDELTDAIADLV